MYGQFKESYPRRPCIQLSVQDLAVNPMAARVEVFPLDLDGNEVASVHINASFGTMTAAEFGKWCAVFHVASQISRGETYMVMGDGAKTVIDSEGQLWERVKEIQEAQS